MSAKMTKLKMRCLVCGWEADVTLFPIEILHKNKTLAHFYEVSDKYCAECHTLLEQIIDGVAEKDEKEGS